MAFYQAKDLVRGVLAQAMTDSQTNMVLTMGHGARFPATTGGYFHAVIWSPTYASPVDAYNAGKAELVLVTSHDAVSDTIAVIDRAEGGTSAIAHSAGAYVDLTFTKDIFDWLISQAARNHHLVSSYQAGTIARKLYYPHNGSRFLGGATVAVGMSIYVSYFYLFVPEKNGTVDEMMLMRATSGGSSGARFAIYDTVSATDLSCGLRLFDSGQIAIANDASGNTGSKWVSDPSAVNFRKEKAYYLAITLSGTNNVNGANINSTLSYPQLVGADWVAVNNLIFSVGGQMEMALGTNYYDFGFPSDMTATAFTSILQPMTVQTIWLHWAT